MSDNRTTELRKALDFMRIWISDDAHLGESEFSYELEKAEGLRRLEAIEQAISATLGDNDYRQAAEYWKGMCEELLTERIGDERDYPVHDGRYECPDCGNVVYYDELHGSGWTIYVEDYQIPFNCCPNCGKAVER